MTPLRMLERVVRVAERTLGPDHPATQNRRRRLEEARASDPGRDGDRPPSSRPPHRA